MQIRALISVALLSIPTLVLTSEPTTLQQIMQDLSENLVEISDGLLHHDLALTAKGAKAIAEHPQIPPEQVKMVAMELGPEMPAFKQFDVRVHNLALEINAAATAGDRDAAVKGFHRLVDGCLACHDAYKDRVAAVLENQP
jgi:cytochrome c556